MVRLDRLCLSLALLAASQGEPLVHDDECTSPDACASRLLQGRALKTAYTTQDNSTTPFRMLKNKLSGRCLSIGGAGVAGEGLLLLDCGATIERVQKFRLESGHLVVLGEGEVPMCAVPQGGTVRLGGCDKDGGGWEFSASYWGSYGWLKQGKQCLGIKGTMSKKAGSPVVAESCSYMPLSDQKWYWTDKLS
ncbi:unnamed protein product [Effrenium voratum]|nr:unnamed protein product [Effrenium voratum]